MKLLYLLLFLQSSFISIAQKNDTEFGIYFGNDFRNDSATVIANGIIITQNIKLAPTMIDLLNLIIAQDHQSISIHQYNKEEQKLKKIALNDSILNLDVRMNKTWRSFRFDLRNGNYLYPEFNYFRFGWSSLKIFDIKQKKEKPMFL